MAKGDWSLESLKEHYDKILSDRKELDEQRFKAVDDRFQGQKELNKIIQDSSDKAITKAEAAQNQYNVVHNDLSRKNELMQTRVDAEKDKVALEGQLNSMRINLESQINSLRLNIDEKFTNVSDKISPLTSRLDKGSGKEEIWVKLVGWIVAALIALIAYFLKK